MVHKKVIAKSLPLSFPSRLVAPIGNLLRDQLKSLERRKKEIDKKDPFKEKGRTHETPSPDDGAAEQLGHTQIVAIKEQLDKRIIQIRKALTMIKIGKYGICDDCGRMIDTDRLMIEPEATFCARCQGKREK